MTTEVNVIVPSSSRDPAEEPARSGSLSCEAGEGRGRLQDEGATRTSDAPVTLDQLLARREARVHQRQRLLERHRAPLVQLTLVTPGPVKDTPVLRSVFDHSLAVVHDALAGIGCRPDVELRGDHPTGPEALLALPAHADARAVKRRLAALESAHPLGRLIDADVHDADGTAVGRSAIGLPPRRCLVCDAPAHACSRSRAHPLAELQRAMAEIVDAAAR